MHQNFGASILHGLKSKSQLFHFQLFGPLLAFNSVFLEKKKILSYIMSIILFSNSSTTHQVSTKKIMTLTVFANQF